MGVRGRSVTVCRALSGAARLRPQELAVAKPRSLGRLLRGSGAEAAAPLLLAARDTYLARAFAAPPEAGPSCPVCPAWGWPRPARAPWRGGRRTCNSGSSGPRKPHTARGPL
jgi:hypothetical protein